MQISSWFLPENCFPSRKLRWVEDVTSLLASSRVKRRPGMDRALSSVHTAEIRCEED